MKQEGEKARGAWLTPPSRVPGIPLLLLHSSLTCGCMLPLGYGFLTLLPPSDYVPHFHLLSTPI